VESLSLLVEPYTSALACPNMFRAFLQKAVRDTPRFSTLHGPVAALGFLTVAWAKPPIFAWEPYVLRCGDSADEPKQVWPAWGPQRDASMCIVCGCARGSCMCPPKVKDVVKGAFIDMNEVAGHIKYDDLLLKDSTTWLRCELSTSGKETIWFAKCWLCQNFLHREPHPNAKLCRDGLAVGGMQKGQLKDHVTKNSVSGDHAVALKNYNRRCKQFLAENYPSENPEEDKATGQQDVRLCLAKTREVVDIRRANAMHLVYTCVYLCQSAESYATLYKVARLHGANYYGDLYANETFFLKGQRLLAERVFASKWERLLQSPVLIPCSDEAEGKMGLRVQFIEFTEGHTRPASEFMDLIRIPACTAEGVTHGITRFFTDPAFRPENLKALVMTPKHLAKVMEVFLADGATVNGLTTTGRGIRSPLESAREGDNVFWYLQRYRHDNACPVDLIGVWCAPHCVDLVADSITADASNLPTFASFKVFLDQISGELQHSTKSKLDLEFLNLLVDEQVVRIDSLCYSAKEWLSNVTALEEIVSRGFTRLWLHVKDRLRTASGEKKIKFEKQLAFLENPMVHLVLPAYLDIQRQLNLMNKASQKDDATLESVRKSVATFTSWADKYALRSTKKGAAQPSVIAGAYTAFQQNKVPTGMASDATRLEAYLGTLKRVQNTKKKPLTDSTGATGRVMLQRCAHFKNGSDCVINMVWDDSLVSAAHREVVEACQLAIKQFTIRFPKKELLDALSALLSSTAQPEKMAAPEKNKLLMLVAAHWGWDLKDVADSFEEYCVHFEDGRLQGYTGEDLLDFTLTTLMRTHPSSKILQPAYVHFALRHQNATLERDFSKKRRNEDKNPGKMGTECLTQRLHIQSTGKAPDTMKTSTKTAQDFDPLIWGAAYDAMPKDRASPVKRQQTLEDIIELDAITGSRKKRKDAGTTGERVYDTMQYDKKYATVKPENPEHAAHACEVTEPMSYALAQPVIMDLELPS
jgi:hypothetical protein